MAYMIHFCCNLGVQIDAFYAFELAPWWIVNKARIKHPIAYRQLFTAFICLSKNAIRLSRASQICNGVKNLLKSHFNACVHDIFYPVKPRRWLWKYFVKFCKKQMQLHKVFEPIHRVCKQLTLYRLNRELFNSSFIYSSKEAIYLVF